MSEVGTENQQQQDRPFKVFVRIRPFLSNESVNNQSNSEHKNMIAVEDNLIFILDPESQNYYGKKEKSFIFDNIFTDKSSNLDIFNSVIKNSINSLLIGYNSTALAYGVTGTGKTYTMFGDLSKEKSELGVCVHAVNYLFDKINEDKTKEYKVKISYLEIYNETVYDLLSSNQTNLMIVEDQIRGVTVQNLSEFEVDESYDLLHYILEGNSRRKMASTNKNEFSSRSHCILQISLEQVDVVKDIKSQTLNSKFLLVDLAGSEKGGIERGIRLFEGAKINKSLLALGNCINILSDSTKKGCFVPYRDSKLTRLLKDSLGGNIVTNMIACISPLYSNFEETSNTLKYASRARSITKKLHKNVTSVTAHISQYKDIIESMRDEINKLKEIIREQNSIITSKLIESEDIVKNDSKLEKAKSITNIKSNFNVFHEIPVEQVNDALTYQDYRSETNEDNENLEYPIERFEFIIDNISNIKKTKDSKEFQEFFEKIIEKLNSKMIENIEQNMVLKSNLREISELNENNQQIVSNYEKQISLLPEEEKTEENKKYNKILFDKDIMINNINENIKTRQGIIKSIEKNEQDKQKLKFLFIKILSYSNNEVLQSQLAYQKIEKEKKELEEKNKNLSSLINIKTEKEKTEIKYNEVLRELEVLKRVISEKDSKLMEYEEILKENLINKSQCEEGIALLKIKDDKNDDNSQFQKVYYERNYGHQIVTNPQELIDNLHPKRKKRKMSNSSESDNNYKSKKLQQSKSVKKKNQISTQIFIHNNISTVNNIQNEKKVSKNPKNQFERFFSEEPCKKTASRIKHKKGVNLELKKTYSDKSVDNQKQVKKEKTKIPKEVRNSPSKISNLSKTRSLNIRKFELSNRIKGLNSETYNHKKFGTKVVNSKVLITNPKLEKVIKLGNNDELYYSNLRQNLPKKMISTLSQFKYANPETGKPKSHVFQSETSEKRENDFILNPQALSVNLDTNQILLSKTESNSVSNKKAGITSNIHKFLNIKKNCGNSVTNSEMSHENENLMVKSESNFVGVSVNQLKQARLEKQLKNQDKEKHFSSISKNAVLFLNDYTSNKLENQSNKNKYVRELINLDFKRNENIENCLSE